MKKGKLKIQHAHTNQQTEICQCDLHIDTHFHKFKHIHTRIHPYMCLIRCVLYSMLTQTHAKSASHCKKPPLSLPPPMATTTIILTWYSFSQSYHFKYIELCVSKKLRQPFTSTDFPYFHENFPVLANRNIFNFYSLKQIDLCMKRMHNTHFQFNHIYVREIQWIYKINDFVVGIFIPQVQTSVVVVRSVASVRASNALKIIFSC